MLKEPGDELQKPHKRSKFIHHAKGQLLSHHDNGKEEKNKENTAKDQFFPKWIIKKFNRLRD